MLTEVFLTFLITSLIGFSLATLKLIHSSKCSRCDCGCIHIVRNVEVEEREDARNNQPQPQPQNQV